MSHLNVFSIPPGMLSQPLPWANSSNTGNSFLKKDHCPGPAGRTCFDTGQDAIGLLSTWAHAGSGSVAVAQNPQVFLLQFSSHSSLSLKHCMKLLWPKHRTWHFASLNCSDSQHSLIPRVPEVKACSWTVTSEQRKCSRAVVYSPEIVCHALSF